jgi:threonine dehydrogenase-like Zn-dependent dehydrogenase
MMMFKRISIKSGAVTPHVHHEAMKKLIESGKANLDFVWGKEIGIHDAPETYREFSSREILKPVIRF